MQSCNGVLPGRCKLNNVGHAYASLNVLFFIRQNEVLIHLSESTNSARFDFLRKLLEILPDHELTRVPELANKALKRRCRFTKQTKKSLAKSGKSIVKMPCVPAPQESSCVPVPQAEEDETKEYEETCVPVPQEPPCVPVPQVKAVGWYRKYGQNIVAIDVEKVGRNYQPYVHFYQVETNIFILS